MAAIRENERGRVSVSSTVIAKLAGFSATSCYGVVGMAAKSGKDGMAKLLKIETIDKGIKVRIEENVINISLHIIVGYGVNLRSIGETIQSSVKYHVEEAIGMEVGEVTVVIEGVRE